MEKEAEKRKDWEVEAVARSQVCTREMVVCRQVEGLGETDVGTGGHGR